MSLLLRLIYDAQKEPPEELAESVCCATCLFSRYADLDGKVLLRCHRLPPVPGDVRSLWPTVWPEQWCGEYAGRT